MIRDNRQRRSAERQGVRPLNDENNRKAAAKSTQVLRHAVLRHSVITIGLLSLVLVAVLGLLFILLTQLWTLEVAFIRVSWIPPAALLLEGIFFGPMTSALSYFAIAIPVFTCIASLFLTFIGATLVASARQRHEHHVGLFRATLVASIPGDLLAAYILYAFLAHAFRSGA